ncbi:MAG: DNA methyltransferase [Bacteroidales bacterium]
MKNRFNRLTSKEWLPFQKSWFRYESDEMLLWENIRFFNKTEISESVMLYAGKDAELAREICADHDIEFRDMKDYAGETVQFAVFDLRHRITEKTGMEEYTAIRDEMIEFALKIYPNVEYKRFISVWIPNIQKGEAYYPFAWDLAKHLGQIFSLKDEKIACPEAGDNLSAGSYFQPAKSIFYCLYFKKDDNSAGEYSYASYRYSENNRQQKSGIMFNNTIPGWFILKPQPRKKNEILHPAKYPEELVSMFVDEFSRKGDNIFDPMTGTGSTQLGALKLGRNGYGTELSEFFTEIANERCRNFVAPLQKELFSEERLQDFRIVHKDARLVSSDDFPPVDYMLTSPPYWDMLNMKGAENQAKRLEKGLLTNYSDSDRDLGNIDDYIDFVSELTEIYFSLIPLMKPGSYITIVVKNIKKKGRNYPFAWDLAHALQEKLILLPEVFWCQDDISIAPYGYGNTWVSNTFHQYCLTFQVPGK